MINHYGVDIDLRVYDSTELGPLRKKRSPHHRQQGKWPFHVDPYNPMTVWLELGDQFLPLDWRSPYSGAPMADEVWRVARAQAAARGESEPSTDDLNEVMRRFMYKGNALPTKRQKKRAISARTDPLAITNQLPHFVPAAPPGGALSATGDVGDKNADVVAAKPAWPVAAPFGMTRSPDEA